MSLAEIQARFFALTYGAPERTAAAAALFSGPSAARPQERIEMYRRATFMRCAHFLEMRLRRTVQLLGPIDFQAALTAHLEAAADAPPSRERPPEAFAAYLRQSGARWGRADAADLALLECAHYAVAHAAPEPAVGSEVLRGLDASALAGTRLRLVSPVRILRLDSDVAALWQALEAGSEPPAPAPVATSVLVWHNARGVFHRALDAHDEEALRRALAGATVAEVCEAFVDAPDAADRAYAVLASWFAEGFVAALERALPPAA